jgi:hypothetical protein
MQKAVIQHAREDMVNAPPTERMKAAVEEKSLFGVIGEIIKEEIIPAVEAEGKRLAALGAYEMGGLWTGNAYRGDLGLLASGATPAQQRAPQEINVNVKMPDAGDRAQYQSRDTERDLGR